MTLTEEEIKAIRQELQWIDLNEYSKKKEKSNGILSYLVPLGCLVTAGVLCRGLYFLHKRNSKEQQKMMRLRVLSQGVTALLAAVGILQFRVS